MSMEAFILGTGGMMPLPNRHLTSVLLRREGSLFLFDAGEGTQVSLRKLNLKWKKINCIFVSHMHADHITGIPGILMLSAQVDRDEPLYIIGPPKIKEYVESSRRILDMYINYEIIVKEINPAESEVVWEEDDFTVRSVPMVHSKPCVGYVLEEKERPGVFAPEKARELNVPVGPLWAQLQSGNTVQNTDGNDVLPEQVMGPKRRGRKFSFVTDTKYHKGIHPYVGDSDLFICEGMFAHELLDSAREKKHLTAVQAATIAKDAGGIKKMGLIHYSPRYIERDLKLMLKEAKKVFPDTFLTRDCMILDIPHSE